MALRYQSQFTTAGAEPRFEVVPLLDCVFQLLIFALYSLVLMVHARVMPVKLPSLATSEPVKQSAIVGITLDQRGQLFLNQHPVAMAQLGPELAKLTRTSPPPAVLVALDNRRGPVDRGPTLLALIDILRQAGVKNFSFVGNAEKTGSPPPQPLTPNP